MGKVIWKLVLVGMVVAWAGLHLVPLQDTPFEKFVSDRATANKQQYKAFLEDARESVENGSSPSLYHAMLNLANKREVDLHQRFFPDINLVQTNRLKKRNEVMMRVLLKHSQSRIKLGLDLSGGIAFTLRIPESELEGLSQEQQRQQLQQVISVMRDRVNAFGVTEPVIRPKNNNAVEIQLPGISSRNDPEAVDKLKKPAKLEFREVHPSQYPGSDEARGSETLIGGSKYEVLILEQYNRRTDSTTEQKLYVKKLPLATGKIIDEAFPSTNQYGGYRISMNFTSEGADKFAQITRNIANQGADLGRMAIVLDGKLYSAPTVEEEIRGGRAQISGDFSRLEAVELSNVLNNPLAIELKLAEMYEVGPTLAADARENSIRAAILGATLVVLFMLFYYRVSGLVAIVTVVVNLFMVIGILASIGGTITLPGVAALVLTIGMAVDANILIFERIREELRLGKRMASSVEGGFNKALSTIVDANVTTLITALILIWLGTGPVKGFGMTLAIGIGSTLFTALILTRALMELLLSLGVEKLFRSGITPPSIPFQNYRRRAFILSWIIVGFGILAVWDAGDKAYGIDFLGGEEITLEYEDKLSVEAIQDVAKQQGLGEVNVSYQSIIGDEEQQVIKLQTEEEQGAPLFQALSQAHPDAELKKVGENRIGPTVSKTITFNAFLSVAVALVGMLLYIAIRFEIGYGIGAIVATVHDVLMTIGLFILLGQLAGLGSGQFTAPMVAAILMIVGYSLNDTIVVFDRIREELELNPGLSLFKVINHAINCMLSRTLLTSITTLLAATALFFFGAGVVTDYALVFIIGIFTGTFSSIFIASPVFFWWHKGDRQHVEEREILPKYEWETGAS